MKQLSSIDDYLDSKTLWKDALLKLRQLFLSTELEENLKWGMPRKETRPSKKLLPA